MTLDSSLEKRRVINEKEKSNFVGRTASGLPVVSESL